MNYLQIIRPCIERIPGVAARMTDKQAIAFQWTRDVIFLTIDHCRRLVGDKYLFNQVNQPQNAQEIDP